MKRQPPVAEVAVATCGGAAQGVRPRKYPYPTPPAPRPKPPALRTTDYFRPLTSPEPRPASSGGPFKLWGDSQCDTPWGRRQGVLGGVMGKLGEMQPPTPPGQAQSPMSAMNATRGTPLMQARNFAVLTGVHSGLSCAVKIARGGVEDVRNTMIAAFGSGAAFSVVSGMGGANATASAVTTGIVFALLQGGFYKVGKAFQNRGGGKKSATATVPEADPAYYRADQMLDGLGLGAYQANFRAGLLSDQTLPLMNDGALQECRIPPGPRLLIMDHVKSNKAFYEKDLLQRSKKLAEERQKYL